MQHVYKIEGLQCGACVKKIQTALQPIVTRVDISLSSSMISIDLIKPLSLEALNAIVSTVGNYRLVAISTDTKTDTTNRVNTYYPLILIIVYITLGSFITNIHATGISWHSWMNDFMAGFFLVFSAFKLLDLKGFATAYATYDILAARWRGYGYLYPFLELTLGLAYLSQQASTLVLGFTVVLMGFSSIGVIQVLLQKRKIRCACLGTVLKLPMSGITLVEDLLMVVMALVMLIMR